jgi:hypothetical protein
MLRGYTLGPIGAASSVLIWVGVVWGLLDNEYLLFPQDDKAWLAFTSIALHCIVLATLLEVLA